MYVAILNQARAWRRISRAVANFVGRARQVLRRLASAWMTTSEANPASRQAQALGHQVLDASSNYERLRHCAERRETEFLCTPGNRAGSEIIAISSPEMIVFSFAAISFANCSRRRFTSSGTSTHREPLLYALRRYVCEKLAAITRRTPLAFKQVTACSRLEPVPKLKPPTITSPARVRTANCGS